MGLIFFMLVSSLINAKEPVYLDEFVEFMQMCMQNLSLMATVVYYISFTIGLQKIV